MPSCTVCLASWQGRKCQSAWTFSWQWCRVMVGSSAADVWLTRSPDSHHIIPWAREPVPKPSRLRVTWRGLSEVPDPEGARPLPHEGQCMALRAWMNGLGAVGCLGMKNNRTLIRL